MSPRTGTGRPSTTRRRSSCRRRRSLGRRSGCRIHTRRSGSHCNAGVGEQATLHWPMKQYGVAFAAETHTLPQVPQLLASLPVLVSQPSAGSALQSTKERLHPPPRPPAPAPAPPAVPPAPPPVLPPRFEGAPPAAELPPLRGSGGDGPASPTTPVLPDPPRAASARPPAAKPLDGALHAVPIAADNIAKKETRPRMVNCPLDPSVFQLAVGRNGPNVGAGPRPQNCLRR